MQRHLDTRTRVLTARKLEQIERRSSLDRAVRELRARATQRVAADYGCVEWYFYDESFEKRERA